MNFIGYDSFTDFSISVFGLYTKTAIMLNISLTGVLTLIASFVEEWIWPDVNAVYILLAILVGDWITGMVRGIRSEEGFKTNLALRIFPKIAVYGLILSGVQKGFPDMVESVFYSGIIGITLISLVKNAAAIGWIKGEVAVFLKKYVDKHKNPLD